MGKTAPLPQQDTTEAALVAAIEAQPDRPDAYLVYADWLLARGDWRGELIALQHGLASAPDDERRLKAADRLLKRHQQQYLPLQPQRGDPDIVYEWQYGFIKHARVVVASNTEHRALRLLEQPAARFIQSLDIYCWTRPSEALPSKVARRRPATLRRLLITQRQTDLEQALATADDVRWLVLYDLGQLPDEVLGLTNLRWLELRRFHFEQVPAELAQLPNLRRLDLPGCRDLREIPTEVLSIPSLEHVSLHHTDGLDDRYHMGQLNSLLTGFCQRRRGRAQRAIEIDLLLERSSTTDIEALLVAADSNLARVRQAALARLQEVLGSSCETPLGEHSEIALVGEFDSNKKLLGERLAALGTRTKNRAGRGTTLLVCGGRGGAAALLARQRGVPVVVESQLLAWLERDSADEIDADGDSPSDPRQLEDALRGRDEAAIALALSALRRRRHGVPETLVIDLLLVMQDVALSDGLRKEARKLFNLLASARLKLAVKTHLKSSLLLESMGEDKRAARAVAFCRTVGTIAPHELCRRLAVRAGVGVKYLFDTGQPELIHAAFVAITAGGAISLAARELEAVPQQLSELSWLRELDLSNNHLSRFPEPVLQLTGLERLDLSGNRLWKIPDGLAALHQLRVLDLSKNRLTRFPRAVCQLRQLEQLDLSSPSAYGKKPRQLLDLPVEIGQLTQLRRLAFRSNRPAALPDQLWSLPALERLDLVGCVLPAAIPPGIAKARALIELRIGYTAWVTDPLRRQLRQLLPGCRIS